MHDREELMKILENYRYGVETQVCYQGDWQHIDSVWLYEKRIQMRESGIIIDYSEVGGIKG